MDGWRVKVDGRMQGQVDGQMDRRRGWLGGWTGMETAREVRPPWVMDGWIKRRWRVGLQKGWQKRRCAESEALKETKAVGQRLLQGRWGEEDGRGGEDGRVGGGRREWREGRRKGLCHQRARVHAEAGRGGTGWGCPSGPDALPSCIGPTVGPCCPPCQGAPLKSRPGPWCPRPGSAQTHFLRLS